MTCRQCGMSLAADQEWCLECGTANTVIRKAPDWRVAAATVSLLVLIALVAFVAALAST